MVDVDIVLAVFVEEESSEVEGVGDVGDFFQFLRERECDEVSEPGESDVLEPFLGCHGAESLSVGPGIAI